MSVPIPYEILMQHRQRLLERTERIFSFVPIAISAIQEQLESGSQTATWRLGYFELQGGPCDPFEDLAEIVVDCLETMYPAHRIWSYYVDDGRSYDASIHAEPAYLPRQVGFRERKM